MTSEGMVYSRDQNRAKGEGQKQKEKAGNSSGRHHFPRGMTEIMTVIGAMMARSFVIVLWARAT